MRIAIGQLWQESNTFNPIPTSMADFEAFGISEGDDLIRRMADTNELGGFIQELRQWPERPEIVGLVRLPAWPSGPATADAFAELMCRMLDALRGAGAVDAVLLALHGSLVSVAEPDVEGHLLERVRRHVGPAVPVVATLDLHANVTTRMVTAADALVLYHTAPHIDVMDTGRRGARVLRRILIDGAKPVSAFVKMPLVLPVERANTQDHASPSFAIRERLQECERDPRILSAGLATVQPWLDIPELGSAVLVVADGDAVMARVVASGLANHVWRRRADFMPTLTSVSEGVRLANVHPEGLTVLGDGADATTSGSTGDGTALLAELIRYDWPRPALVTLVSPEIVEEANRRGVGAEWTVTLGGVRDTRFARPLTLPIRVAGLFDARFVLSGHLAENMPIDMGRSAVLRHGNVHIVVTSRTGPHFAPQLFEAAGLDPFAASVLVAKSPCGFRAAYAGRAAQIFSIAGPGCAPPDFWNYPYAQIPRPLWPWDEVPEWKAEPIMFGAP
jgi:microcystin degradation protein MlrC